MNEHIAGSNGSDYREEDDAALPGRWDGADGREDHECDTAQQRGKYPGGGGVLLKVLQRRPPMEGISLLPGAKVIQATQSERRVDGRGLWLTAGFEIGGGSIGECVQMADEQPRTAWNNT